MYEVTIGSKQSHTGSMRGGGDLRFQELKVPEQQIRNDPERRDPKFTMFYER
jgi:hypothetical protein